MLKHRYMRRYAPIALGLIFLLIVTWFLVAKLEIAPSKISNKSATQTASFFVTRSGSSLMLAGKQFRFSGPNIYWLGMQETDNGNAYPSHFRVDDALATAEIMGATVVRSHTLGISVGCTICVEPRLGVFNQLALQSIDYAIACARVHHIRLIIPLVDNWHYYHGGKHTFTTWRGLSNEKLFYSDPQVIGDFEAYISVILNHVNRYNGVAYKDDPTILAWETGNELSAPSNWVQKIATYIKGLDTHHLLVDGNYEQPSDTANFLPDLHINELDIFSGHYYPPTISAFQTEVSQAQAANKVFIADEYDWNTSGGDALGLFLPAIEHSAAAGDLYWSLFPHDDSYGFVPHNEHYTLHYPGDTPQMRTRVTLLTAHAYAMRSLSVPAMVLPDAPAITSVSGKRIAWRGVAGAYIYTVERSVVGATGPWTVVCNQCATDNTTPWTDRTRPSGSVWYRVKGYSLSGVVSLYSKVSPAG
ncbi:MAG: hypothetical protein ABI456_09225 [Ktedonobacteraceae bacterium]|nr:hypothetical protein [Chloroflexota bacterium]